MGTSTAIPRLVAVAAGALLLLLLAAALLPEEPAAPEALAPTASPTLGRRATALAARPTLAFPRPPSGPPLQPTATPLATPSQPELIGGERPEARVDRGGLTLRVVAPDDTLVAGSIVDVELQLQNNSQNTIELTETSLGTRGPRGLTSAFQVRFLDSAGEAVEGDESWYTSLRRSAEGELAPGASVSETHRLFVPAVAEPNQSYSLWGSVSYIYRDQRGVNRGLRQLDSGPITIQIVAPAPERQLVAELVAGDDSISVQLVAPQTPPAGLEGALLRVEAGVPYGSSFRFDDQGSWGLPWDGGQPPTQVRVIVSAPGYASAVLTHTPGEEPARQPVVQQRTYATREEAQPGIPFTLLALEPLLAGARLESVEVVSQQLELEQELSVTQLYQLPPETDGHELNRANYLTLLQSKAESISFADADYVEVDLLERTGYARLRYGRWALTWNNETSIVTLAASASQLELDELVQLARQLAVPDGRRFIR